MRELCRLLNGNVWQGAEEAEDDGFHRQMGMERLQAQGVICADRPDMHRASVAQGEIVCLLQRIFGQAG